MIFLDTHVVIWLYARLFDKLSPLATKLINDNDLCCCPMVKLELKYLYEIERLSEEPNLILNNLETEIGLRIRNVELGDLVDQAMPLNWTRDPFDRLIVAQSKSEEAFLLTKDETILRNFKLARW